MQGRKTFQGAMREKIANYKGGNSVCRGLNFFRVAMREKIANLKYLKEGNSVCRGTRILRSHFDSKQKGKALPFCSSLLRAAKEKPTPSTKSTSLPQHNAPRTFPFKKYLLGLGDQIILFCWKKKHTL